MKYSALLLSILCLFAPPHTRGGELTVELGNACQQNSLSDGMHYVSIKTPKLVSLTKQNNNKITSNLKSKTLQELRQEIETFESNKYQSQFINLIDSNINTNSNDNNIAYLLYVQCYNGNMYIDTSDFSLLFDDNYTPSKGYEVNEVSSNESSLDEEGISADDSPFTSSNSKKTIKWTAQYIVWLVLIIMVGIFGIGIFGLLYWWCCRARTYHSNNISSNTSFNNTAYTQLPTGDTNIYGSTENNVHNENTMIPIDDTMVSQMVTVENDVLP